MKCFRAFQEVAHPRWREPQWQPRRFGFVRNVRDGHTSYRAGLGTLDNLVPPEARRSCARAATVIYVTDYDDMLLPSSRFEPLSRGELEAAVSEVTGDTREAAWLLALPVGDVPGINVGFSDGTWHWRDAMVQASDDHIGDVIALIEQGRTSDDRYVAPSGQPWQWVRPTRSGSHIVVWGAESLLGLAQVTVESSVNLEAIFDLMKQCAGDTAVRAPALVDTQAGPLFVTGDEKSWHVIAAHAPETAESTKGGKLHQRMLSAGAQLGERLGAQYCEAGPLSTLEDVGATALYQCYVGESLFEVPVIFALGSTIMGVSPFEVDSRRVGGPDVVALPSGWLEVGPAMRAGRTVVVAPDGTWAYFVHASNAI